MINKTEAERLKEKREKLKAENEEITKRLLEIDRSPVIGKARLTLPKKYAGEVRRSIGILNDDNHWLAIVHGNDVLEMAERVERIVEDLQTLIVELRTIYKNEA